MLVPLRTWPGRVLPCSIRQHQFGQSNWGVGREEQWRSLQLHHQRTQQQQRWWGVREVITAHPCMSWHPATSCIFFGKNGGVSVFTLSTLFFGWWRTLPRLWKLCWTLASLKIRKRHVKWPGQSSWKPRQQLFGTARQLVHSTSCNWHTSIQFGA